MSAFNEYIPHTYINLAQIYKENGHKLEGIHISLNC